MATVEKPWPEEHSDESHLGPGPSESAAVVQSEQQSSINLYLCWHRKPAVRSQCTKNNDQQFEGKCVRHLRRTETIASLNDTMLFFVCSLRQIISAAMFRMEQWEVSRPGHDSLAVITPDLLRPRLIPNPAGPQ